MKKISLLLLAASFSALLQAQISITPSTLTYTQNFDNLDTAVYNASTNPGSTNLPAGWSIFEYGTSPTRVNNGYVGEYGSSNTGDTYSFGSVGSTERALGSIASGSVISHYGAKFINNTGSTITGFTIKYRGEQWRLGQVGRTPTTLDSLRFLYSTTATGISDTNSTYNEDFNLLLTSPNYTGTVAGAIDGNAPGNFVNKNGTVSVFVANGGSLVIKWVDKNVLGSDDGLALDSISITFSTVLNNHPALIATSPLNNATGVSTSSNLVMTFNRNVAKGTSGNIYVKNELTQTSQAIPVTNSNVTINGSVVTISGVPLAKASVYHVTFDSVAFDTGKFNSYGLYDTAAWKFSTQGLGIINLAAGSIALTVINPVHHGDLSFLADFEQAAAITASIYDLNGRNLVIRQFQAIKGKNRFVMPTGLPAGTYLIRVNAGSDWGSAKVSFE